MLENSAEYFARCLKMHSFFHASNAFLIGSSKGALCFLTSKTTWLSPKLLKAFWRLDYLVKRFIKEQAMNLSNELLSLDKRLPSLYLFWLLIFAK